MSGRPQKAVAVGLSSTRILKPGETLRVTVPPSEVRRLSLEQAFLSVPGVCRQMRMKPSNGALVAQIPILDGGQWRSLPTFIQSAGGKTYRGSAVSISSRGPVITRYGPQKAESRSTPCWVDYEGPAYLLNPGRTVIRVHPDARVSNILHRPGRINFWLSTDNPGRYTVEVKTVDKAGRTSTASWPVTVD